MVVAGSPPEFGKPIANQAPCIIPCMKRSDVGRWLSTGCLEIISSFMVFRRRCRGRNVSPSIELAVALQGKEL